MKMITLYRTIRDDGGVDVSPEIPEDREYETLSRLIAGEGKILTNNGMTAYCIDVEDPTGWEEIDAPEDIDDSEDLE